MSFRQFCSLNDEPKYYRYFPDPFSSSKTLNIFFSSPEHNLVEQVSSLLKVKKIDVLLQLSIDFFVFSSAPNLCQQCQCPGLQDLLFEPNSTITQEIISCLEGVDILVVNCVNKGYPGHYSLKLEATDFVSAVNNFIITKYLIRKIFARHGKSVTFIPRPLAAVTSGLELSIALEGVGAKTFALGVSENIEALNAFCNPFSNSFKRLDTSPELANIDLISEKKQQVSFKFLDCICNPCLAFSALLLAGISFGAKINDVNHSNVCDAKLIFSRGWENSLETIKKDLSFCHNIFDKSLVSNYITGIKDIEKNHNFDISARENMLYYNL
jgi:glutamine synthetase